MFGKGSQDFLQASGTGISFIKKGGQDGTGKNTNDTISKQGGADSSRLKIENEDWLEFCYIKRNGRGVLPQFVSEMSHEKR